ncbi:MAG TPA: ATPase, T2SS/T4P/T4SS family [Oscillospiraceae bacterium]|nr:stage III sporulation protein AA [Oscillospiraceae bacterium]HNW04735.1 ATPase, T2SS/T4P/T4SS family [Oscillospiraceae bacterium]HPW00254.1 ATPase, T2SS/T4P/T4SS family [Oscillospiraceae bacterium]
MKNKTIDEIFEEIQSCSGQTVSGILSHVDREIRKEAREIRLAAGSPMQIVTAGELYFCSRKGEVFREPERGWYPAPCDIDAVFRAVCQYSIHAYADDIASGFVTIRGGHRAGVCGTAVYERGALLPMAQKNISSINIRIARQIFGAADPILAELRKSGLCSILVIGPPCSGKTTVLRDLVRQLASGKTGAFVRTSVIDERSELAAMYESEPQNDVGVTCDVLNGFGKREGILTAIRAFAPEMIVCDELGGAEDMDAVREAARCGSCLAASIHAESMESLLLRPNLLALMASGIFDMAVLMGKDCRIQEIRALSKEGAR